MPMFHDEKGGSTFAGTMGAAMQMHKDKKEKEHSKSEKGHNAKHDEHLAKAKEHIDSAMQQHEAEEAAEGSGGGVMENLGAK